MGFFKDLFFKKKEEQTKVEKQVEENIKAGADYSHVLDKQEIYCSGCSQLIDGKPRIKEHQGKTLFFHKRCYKAMKRGTLLP